MDRLLWRLFTLCCAASLVGCAAGEDTPRPETEAGRAPAPADSVPAAALALARTVADNLAQDLGGLLMTTLAERGPVAAVAVGADTAQDRTAAHSSGGIYVRRVSDRLRNPLNTPDSAERRDLERLAALHRERRLPPEIAYLDRSGDAPVLHYLRPIVVAPACLTCHGPRATGAARSRGAGHSGGALSDRRRHRVPGGRPARRRVGAHGPAAGVVGRDDLARWSFRFAGTCRPRTLDRHAAGVPW
jgi:hypothetical protein